MRGNHKPEISGTDDGVWRRIHLIPFHVRIPNHERNPNLLEELKTEAPGILRWMVEGYADWKDHGLDPPCTVIRATKDYRAEMDLLAQFIEEECETGNPTYEVQSGMLCERYNGWLRQRGAERVSAVKFAERMGLQGYTKRQARSGKLWTGLQLRKYQ